MENSTDKFDLGDFCKKLRQILGYGYPLKERLADILEGEEDGLTKEELIASFKTKQGVSRWELACFFYQIGGKDGPGGDLDFNQVVQAVDSNSNSSSKIEIVDDFDLNDDMVEEGD